MKKILLTLGTVATITAPLATVVACEKYEYEYVFGKATVEGNHLIIEGFEQPSVSDEEIQNAWFNHMGSMLERSGEAITKVTLKGKVSNALGLADFETSLDFEYMYLFDDLSHFIQVSGIAVDYEVPLDTSGKAFWSMINGIYDGTEDDGAEEILSGAIKVFLEKQYLETTIPKGGFTDLVATETKEYNEDLGLGSDANILVDYLLLYGVKVISLETKAGIDSITLTYDFSSGNKYTATIGNNLSFNGEATVSELEEVVILEAALGALTFISTKNSTDDLSTLTATTPEEAIANFGITTEEFENITNSSTEQLKIESISQNDGEAGTIKVNYVHTESNRKYTTIISNDSIEWADETPTP